MTMDGRYFQVIVIKLFILLVSTRTPTVETFFCSSTH